MPQSNTEELNLKEYRQRRRLGSLRRQLYAQSDPANATKLTQAIDKAELELQQTQQDRRASGWTSTASTPANGVLLSTDPTRNTRGVSCAWIVFRQEWPICSTSKRRRW